MATTIPGFRETVEATRVFNPIIYPAAPCNLGLYMGPMLEGQAPYHFDGWDWMHAGISDSTVEVWVSNKNRGKSASNKSHCRRLRLRRADRSGRVPRISAFDLKPLEQEEREKRDDTGRIIYMPADASKKKRRAGEYRPLAFEYGCRPIEPATRKFNMMHSDFQLTFGENLRQLEFAVERATESRVTHYQMEALKVAVWLMRENMHGLRPSFTHAYLAARRMTDEDIRAFNASIDAELLEEAQSDPYYTSDESDKQLIASFQATLAQPQNVDFERVKQGASEIKGILQTVMARFPWISGVDSLYADLSQEVVVHDCNFMSDEEIAEYQSQLRIIASSASRRGDDNLRVDIEVHEENATSWNQITYARDMFPHIKRVRQDARTIKLITQFLRDYETVGGEGSETSRKAVAMISNVDHIFMGRMPAAEVAWVHRNIFEMTEYERQMVEKLGVGDFGHKTMPHFPMQFFHYRLASSDWRIAESNAAINDRQG